MKVKFYAFLLIFIIFFNSSKSNEINFYFDNKYMSYKDKFLSELAIKYNGELNNFGITIIGRAFDRKSNYINAILYYDNEINRIEIGNYNDILQYLQAGIVNISKTTNDNDYIFNLDNKINNIISRPTLLSNQNFGYFDDNIVDFNKTKHKPKVNYILNFNEKLSFGLTFMDKYKIKNEYIYNIYEYGINYYDKIDELNFNLSFIGENNFKNDFYSYDFGVDFNYYGILFGGNYGNGKNLNKKQYNYYSYGIGYEIKSLTLSLWHFKGDFDFDNSTNFNISYNVNKYINIYSEINRFKIKNKLENSINFGIIIKNL